MHEAIAGRRVALVTPYFETHGGGVERVAGRLARELCLTSECDITWFGSDCDPAPTNLPARVRAVPMRAFNGVERLTGLPFPLWSPSSLLRLTRGIRDSDVVQLHEFVYPSSVVAMALAWWHHVPVVMVQHTGAVRPTGRVPRWIYALLQALFARSMFRRAAAIIFVSATSRLYWETRFGTLARARTIWNGVETAAPRSAAPRATRPTVLFVGRLVRKKGVCIVRNVAAALPEIRFVIAGRGIEDPRSWKLPNVDAVGHVDAIRLGVLYREADVLLLPSYSEGYPLVVQEALLEGLAVLTTDEVAAACPPASDLLRHCPVPTTDDPEPWRRALVDAMADEAWLRAREQRSVRARTLWSWRGCATAHADALAGAMSRDA